MATWRDGNAEGADGVRVDQLIKIEIKIKMSADRRNLLDQVCSLDLDVIG